MNALLSFPEKIHPALWRASQLARGRGHVVDTGYSNLSAELPGGGWPISALVEVLTQHAGVGELRLLAPALAVGKGPIAMIHPPAEPVTAGLSYVGIPPERLLLLRAKTLSDQLWCAEQALNAGTCSAVVTWQSHMRADSLRRLHLTARSGNALFFMIRPLATAQDSSPAELRLAIRPDERGAAIQIIKRKGPTFEGELILDLRPSAVLVSRYGAARRSTSPITPQHEERATVAAALT